MTNIIYTNGSIELLELTKPLWKKLNSHHYSNSKYFKERFDKIDFETRSQKFKNPNLKIKINLASISDKPIGYCISTINEDLIGEIDSIYVDKEYRTLDIGDALMTNALIWLNENTVKRKIIGIAEGNENILSFYSNYGFYPKMIILEEVDK